MAFLSWQHWILFSGHLEGQGSEGRVCASGVPEHWGIRNWANRPLSFAGIQKEKGMHACVREDGNAGTRNDSQIFGFWAALICWPDTLAA